MPGCKMAEMFKSILSPNRKWILNMAEKISKFRSKNQWIQAKKFKINLKFRLTEIFSKFS